MNKINGIEYGADGDKRKTLDVYLPEGEKAGVLVYFHGGGIEAGDSTEADVLAEYLTEKNIVVVSVNYRMYPSAVYPEFLRDAAEATAWAYNKLDEYGGKIYVGGSSAGAYISMMLCFDKRYLAPYYIDPAEINGFIHNAGQPTAHFNVLRERGIDSRRVIVDETAPLYHIGTSESYARMLFIVSEEDMKNRYEQTMLMVSTLKHFEYDQNKFDLIVLPGGHCVCVSERDGNGQSVFGKMIYDFISKEV